MLCTLAICILGGLSIPARAAETIELQAQQSHTVRGQVVDASGVPVAGATVMVKDSQTGTSTDAQGYYSLNCSGNVTLVFSFIGYETVETTVGQRTVIDVTLKEASDLLDDVVVIGYGSMRKTDLTGSVASVSNKDLMLGGKTDAAGALQGALPGVQIQHSNSKPGGSYNILIRGLNTIQGSTAPLIVVDGVQGAKLENINPDDIERIDILKDAASTAIYGSRATNGVVLVTTKRGKKERVQVSYNGYVGVRSYTHLPDMMSGDEYVQIAREAARSGNNNQYKDDSAIFTESELKAIAGHNYFDWVDAGTKNAVMTNHTVSATGGNEMATYALSAGYYYEDGMMYPQEYSRYNMRTAIDVTPVDYLRFGLNMYGTHSVRDTGNSDVLQDLIRMRPTYHPTNLVTGAEEWSYSNGQFNPLTAMKNEFNKTKQYNLIGNIYVEIMPVKDLSIKTTFSPDVTINEVGQYRGTYTKAIKGTGPATSNYAKNSYMNWVWDNQISYKLERDEHRFDVTGVFSMLQTQYERLYGLGNGLSFNSLWYNLQGGATANSSQSDYTRTNLMSYLARANYSYADKYFIAASIRFDGSSKLAPGNKWGSFPSVSAAWRISNESFAQADWLDNLKIRASFGQTGNDNVGAYATAGSISGSKQYTFGSSEVIGNVPNNLRNLELGWERTTEYNVGLDFGFLGNRITGSIEYYNRRTDDLIMNKTVPTTTGYSSVKANVGSVRNSGVEFMLSTENVRTKNFSWHTTFNLAYNKNAIVDLQYKEDLSSHGPSLQGMYGDYSNLWIIGQPIDVNFNVITDRIWQLDEADEAAKFGCKPGQYRAFDLNGDGKITDDDRLFDGKRTPDIIGGMTNTFNFKQFDLSIGTSFQSGARLKNQFYISYALEGNTMNFNNMRGDYWTPENPSNARHQPSNAGSYGNYKGGIWNDENKATSSHRFSSSNFFKINYITLGYTFNRSKLSRARINGLRIYATVQNPLTCSAPFVVDPEQLTASINSTDYITCNWIFGVNLSF